MTWQNPECMHNARFALPFKLISGFSHSLQMKIRALSETALRPIKMNGLAWTRKDKGECKYEGQLGIMRSN